MLDEQAAKAARGDNFQAALSEAIQASADWLVRRQKPEGYWVGRLESNSCMEAEWRLALWFMGLDDHHLCPRLAASLRESQSADGSWRIYHGAPAGDINTTVEAYAALRCHGDDPHAPHMARARAWILSKGGLRNVRVFTRYWLALIGEWPWDRTPNLPPEVIWFPNWFVFSIYNFAQWARATLMPIAVLSARRPTRPLPAERRLNELFPEGRARFDYELPPKPGADFWDRFFRAADKTLHALQGFGRKTGLSLGRDAAIKRALEWIIRHQDADGVWGGIQPPWIYSLMALHTEGYALDHPVLAKGLAALDDPRWRVDVGEATWIQASTSPVWDTELTLLALHDADVVKAHEAAVERAVQWLLDQQVRRPGDWRVKVPNVEPGGWAFEYKNYFYPDTDDTAVALIALAPFRDDPKWKAKGLDEAIRLGVDWLIGMQSECGGWGAFDKDNDKKILTKIPFCDFGEALDPPSVDVTAHVIEAFGKLGYDKTHPAMKRALDWMKKEQEPDGSWFGRWGVNYVYGTGAALPALEAIGEDMSAPYVQRACDWLVSMQQADGGWGESCASYMDPAMKGRGTPTASQTAWALMGLVAANRAQDREAIQKGLAFLVERQKNGTWEEPEYTGTGFPGYGVGQTIKLGDPLLAERLKQGPELSRAFMINYNLYRHYFPLMAMGRARRLLGA
ncbi:squalene--hopene cyclase [Amphiplicatus metriothermophilus]|uniref:Squalene-hopene/tetraprenyl-beta-curcumene cyclase n=1 Tax=Amphiplicatus metriothermophilus TaxID=1519374 RepID=A0A239PQ81_9PROT|nr:squalene--hopene cyclase [Amphiplicatus metriothermophilus]MBB5518743.1 squalene-hopene/tetraprenyl-beta-curcumene cyclase [Amphiplicatus metriothermophilus]SNT72102.1 squalene-hopene/tetraprenyl-beta-curcumene cyclase [Amphiplicatus metriothermophilus]